MMFKVLCAVLVLSLAYVSEAVFFRDRFPGKTLADLAECKEKHGVSGYDFSIQTTNNYGTKHAVACAKYCLKQKLAGERKDIDKLKNIVGSVWGGVRSGTCYCMSGGTAQFVSSKYTEASTGCIFKPAESEKEDLIPGETCWEEGKQFTGTTFDTAADGRKCDPWSGDDEAWHYYDESGMYDKSRFDQLYYDLMDGLAESYCRNYKLDPKGPYCFIGVEESSFTEVADEIQKGNILSSQEHFVYCDIPKCPKSETAEPECELNCAYNHPKYSTVDVNLNSLAGRTFEFAHKGKTIKFSPCGGMKVGSEQCAAITYGDTVLGIHAPEWDVEEGAIMYFYVSGTATSYAIDTAIYISCKASALEPEFSYNWGAEDRWSFDFWTVCACPNKCDDNGVIE